VSEHTAPLSINHLGQFRPARFLSILRPGSSLGDAVRTIRAVEAEIGLPASMQTSFQGAALAFEASLNNTLLLILAAIVPCTSCSACCTKAISTRSRFCPRCLGRRCALLALMLSHTDLGIIAIIGIILLIGIVKKNAIMMIDFALDAERKEGKSPREAIHQACLLRFRPILRRPCRTAGRTAR